MNESECPSVFGSPLTYNTEQSQGSVALDMAKLGWVPWNMVWVVNWVVRHFEYKEGKMVQKGWNESLVLGWARAIDHVISATRIRQPGD